MVIAFDEAVAERVREALKTQKGVAEKQMFGGIAFMLRGHMLCGVLKSDLMLRLGDEQAAKSLKQAHTRAMDFTGRLMKSMIYVSPEGFATKKALESWLAQAIAHAKTLPPK